MAQTSSQKKNILAMAGFLAFIALMTLLLFVANYISQRTEQEDSSASAVVYDKHYLRVFLHENGMRFYSQFCEATLLSETGTPINFNACGAIRTHSVADLKLPGDFANSGISSISVHPYSIGADQYVEFTVTPLAQNPIYLDTSCKIVNGGITSCFNAPVWTSHDSPTTGPESDLFPKVASYEESEYKTSENVSKYIKAVLSPLPENGTQHLYWSICDKNAQGGELESCPEGTSEILSSSTFNFPTDVVKNFKGIGYSFENHSGQDKLKETFIFEDGNGYIQRLCDKSTDIDIHRNCGAWSKVFYSLNIKNLPEYTTRDWSSMISDLDSVPWKDISEYYVQSFLSTDKTKIYQRSCPVNEDLVEPDYFGDSVIYSACRDWTTHEITSLNATGLTINPQNLKSIDFFEYQKANGSEFLRQQLVINDPAGDIDKLYTRDCPILYKNLECGSAAWTNSNISALQIVDASQNLAKIRGLDTTIVKHTDDLRLRQVALQDDGKSIYSRACEYNSDTLALSNCSAWNKVIINTLDFDNDPNNGLGAIEDVLLATDTYTQMVNGVLNIRQSFLREDGQSMFTRICRLNSTPNGSFDCQANTPEGRLWNEVDLNEADDGVELTVNAASGLDGSVSGARSLALPTIASTSTPTPIPTTAPTDTPAVPKTYIRSFLSEDKGTIYEQSCAVDESLTEDTVKYDACTQFKSYPVSVLNGKKAGGQNVIFSSENVDSVDFFNYKDSTGAERIRTTVLTDNSRLFTRTCALNANKKMNCTNNNNWSVQTIAKLDILDNATKLTEIGGYDASITTHKVSPNVPVLKEYIREVALSKDFKTLYTRKCPVDSKGTADMTIPSDCTAWVKEVIYDTFDFNNNGLNGDKEKIIGVDSYVQKHSNVLSMRVSFINESAETFFTRICPLSEFSGTGIGAYNCYTTPRRTFSEVDIDGSVGLPVAKASGVNGLFSTATSLGFRQVDTSTTPSPTPTLSVVSCSDKSASFAAGGAYIDTKVTYTIDLAYPTPGVTGTVILRDDYTDGMEVDTQSLPDGCTVPEVLGASTALPSDGKVLGISDYYTERGSLLVSVILLSIVSGGTAYVIVLNNKASIKSELFKKNPYLAGLIATGAVLVLGGVLIVLTREDFSPSDTPALTGEYIECIVPLGTNSISYDMTIKGEIGDEISNTVEVLTNNVAAPDTCENTFTIEENEAGTTTPSVSPSASVTPTVELSVTPSITATVELSVTPSITPTVGLSVTPSITPTVGPSVTPTVVGVACGPADINFSDNFEIVDFGGTGGFSSFYNKTCNDSANDFRNARTGINCGGKDSTRDNIVDIHDFVSFASRYTSASCAL